VVDVITIGKTKGLRSCGLDEFWLQDRIAENPSVLQLGELQVFSRERKQSSGGRLDLLLHNPEDDSMYEVEIMLGATDETHIIRTIEYWDIERRRWPKRQHSAVLVAESVTNRFYNVVQLLSHAIPIIAVQVNLVEADGKRVLHFTKILDTYEEPEPSDAAPDTLPDEQFWRENSLWTLEAAKELKEIIAPGFDNVEIKFLKNHILINVNGHSYFWLLKRSGGKSLVGFWFAQGKNRPEAMKLLDEAGITYVQKQESDLLVTANKELIEKHAQLFRTITKLVWDADE
jgi:hypothetical protein